MIYLSFTIDVIDIAFDNMIIRDEFFESLHIIVKH